MGLFASFALHARDRDGPHRHDDHRKTQAGLRKWWERWTCAYLIAAVAPAGASADTLRLAYFHSELTRDGPGLLLRDILKSDPQIEAWRAVVRQMAPDILVIGDIDYDLNGVALDALLHPLPAFSERFTEQPNRGLNSGRDLDGDGVFDEPEDAEGYGVFAGQGGMAIASRWPIDAAAVRNFNDFAWSDLPGGLMIGDGHDPARLSTTVHWDVPVKLPGGTRLHLLVWHGTAPVFDGPEDRNGRRNHDEARFWQLYIDGQLDWDPPDQFVIIGTANADPADGESKPDALRQLLNHPDVLDPQPASEGAVVAADGDGGVNAAHISPHALDTVDWPDGNGDPGNLRVDYVLPSASLKVVASGVYWPEPGSEASADAALASRHRLVWVDVQMPDRVADRIERIGGLEVGE